MEKEKGTWEQTQNMHIEGQKNSDYLVDTERQ